MTVSIQPEEPTDAAGVQRVLEGAFPTAAEARLVDRLRENGNLRVSLVAQANGQIVGYAGFSPVRVDAEPGGGDGAGLAPLAVLRDFERQGIGGRLVSAGLAACRHAGYGFVVVLGSPKYYSRFGFTRADQRGLGNEYHASEEFMIVELRDGAIPRSGGIVRYGSEFAEFAE
jgi:putative acetyltransferase